jgi:hypothetical protein
MSVPFAIKVIAVFRLPTERQRGSPIRSPKAEIMRTRAARTRAALVQFFTR